MEGSGDNRQGVVKTVEIHSARLGARLAASRNSTAADRAEFARALVEDARRRAAALVAGRTGKRPAS